MKIIRKAVLLAVVLAFVAGEVSAQIQFSGNSREPTEQDKAVAGINDENQLRRLSVEAGKREDLPALTAVLRRLSAIRPHNPAYQYELAAAYARADDKSAGYDALLNLQRSGVAYDLAADERMSNLHGTQVWEYLVELNQQAMSPFGKGEVTFELPPEDRLLESIAYDSARDAFLFGSARDGIIYRRAANGRLTAWAQPQGDLWWAIMNLAVDPRGKYLWATTAAIPHFNGFKAEMGGKSALLKIELATGKLAAAYPAPDDGFTHLLNAVAVSSKGTVVVAEGLRGQLFKVDDEKLVPLLAQPSLKALRGLAFSPDGRILYFADHDRGLFGMDLIRNTAFDVAGTGSIFLSGIEGLYQYEGQLVIIQNGFQPERVLRLKLDEDGQRVALAVPLEASQPAFATPTVGALKENALYYIANTQREYYDGYGLRKGDRELPPVKVFRTDVRFNWDYEPPRMPQRIGEQ